MAKKKKKRAKRREKKAKTMLPPRSPDGASTQQTLATLAAEVVEHRVTPRASLAVELHMASESHFFSGLSGDISEGGVFVSTYRDLATGTVVDLEFSLPGSDRVVHATGAVKWHRSASPDAAPGVGIAWGDLAEEDRALIRRYCTMRPPLYYDDVG